MEKWQDKHRSVIKSFLQELNQKSSYYVLKGGTALMECYGLDRFSEDIDLDSIDSQNIRNIIEKYCDSNGYKYRIAKDTNTTLRYFIHYDENNTIQKPLKIEISFRNSFSMAECIVINQVLTYKLDYLALKKANAYSGRDKIRDLYDISFIINNYFDKLSSWAISSIRDAVNQKGIEQFDYLASNQQDELIDIDKLADSFLNMYDKLMLIKDKELDYQHNNIIQHDLDNDMCKDSLSYKRTTKGGR